MRTTLAGCCVTALAIALSACDRETTSGVGLVASAPSPLPAISASIQYVGIPQGPAFGTNGCNSHFPPATTFDVVIAAPMPMRVDKVTIGLIDGTHLGGPMVTYPLPTLTAQFGTTVIVAGVARTFTFAPQFQCGTYLPSHVMGEISLLDSAGLPRLVTVTGPLP